MILSIFVVCIPVAVFGPMTIYFLFQERGYRKQLEQMDRKHRP